MFAAVDLGSNSFRMHIGHQEGESIRIVKTARDPVRLGAGLDEKGNLTPAAMSAAIASLTRFQSILSSYPLSAVRVVATNTLRVARNAADFLPAAERAVGYPIEVISGEEEGRLIYMGVASMLPPDEKRIVIDIGGGSTEIVLGKGAQIEKVESFSIGTVPQNGEFFASGRIDAASFEAAILSARSRFEDEVPKYGRNSWDVAYGSSGTARAIGESIFRNGLGEGVITLRNLDALKRRLIEFGHVDRIDLAGLKTDRITSIAGGLSILIGAMQEFGIKALHPIEAGLRMGVLRDLQLRATRRDRREEAVRAFLRRFSVDERRADRTAHIARMLFALLKGEDDTMARLLQWSARVHEVGQIVSHSGFHKHSAYMIENADLEGFTTREQRVMSRLVLAQKGNLRKVEDNLSDPDFAKAALSLRLAALFMHTRIDIDADLPAVRLRMKNRIDLELPRACIADHPSMAFWMNKEKQAWDEIDIGFNWETA